MAIPEITVAAIRRFCRRQLPPPHDRELRLEATARGNFVTIWQCRSPIDDASGECARVKAAQLRYQATSATWALYWNYRGRRRPYGDRRTALTLEKALKVIDDDPSGAFFG